MSPRLLFIALYIVFLWMSLVATATTTASNSNFCGGFAGIQCEDGFYCVDDPSDLCDPANGGADCGGICVAVGDSYDLCGGFAGIQCEDGLYCVDDPRDDCDPTNGDADCDGICVAVDDTKRTTEAAATTGSSYDFCGGFAGIQCEDGLYCADDPSDGCNPVNGDADCGGICVAVDDTTTTTTTTSGGGICAQQDVNDLRPSFDNSESTTNGFGWCKFCVCRSLGDPQCERLVNLYLEASEETIQIFNDLCDAADYVDLQDASGEQCDFGNVRVKEENDIENCWCDALYCSGNPFYEPRSGSRSIGNQVTMLCIGFMVSFFWWM